MTRKKLIEILEDAECCGFDCPFGMYGRNKHGYLGCFAKYPHGDPDEENQGCIAHQAARILREQEATNEG